MKNILFINYGENWIRGQEVCLINLLKNVDRNKYCPIAICNSERLNEELIGMGLVTYLIKLPEISLDGKYSKFEILSYLKNLLRIGLLIKKHKVELVYSNSGLPSQIGYVLSRLFSIHLITHIHSPHPKRYPWMWLFKFADKVIFVCEATREDMVRKVTIKNAELVYNGIDEERFSPVMVRNELLRKSYSLDDNTIVIGQVGSLIYRKGVDILIQSFALLLKKHENIKLIIVGDGPDKGDFIELCKSLGVDDLVMFIEGVRNTESIYQHLFDINVLASRSESLPLTLLEGAACGLPNVGAMVGGIPEIIDDGKTGYLFEKENVKQLSEKLELLINDRNLRRDFGRSGRKKIESKFSIKRYSENIFTIIDSCLHSSASI